MQLLNAFWFLWACATNFYLLVPPVSTHPHPNKQEWVSDIWWTTSHSSLSPASLQAPLLWPANHFTSFPLPSLWVDFIIPIGMTWNSPWLPKKYVNVHLSVLEFGVFFPIDPSTLCTCQIIAGAKRTFANMSNFLDKVKTWNFFLSTQCSRWILNFAHNINIEIFVGTFNFPFWQVMMTRKN